MTREVSENTPIDLISELREKLESEMIFPLHNTNVGRALVASKIRDHLQQYPPQYKIRYIDRYIVEGGDVYGVYNDGEQRILQTFNSDREANHWISQRLSNLDIEIIGREI